MVGTSMDWVYGVAQIPYVYSIGMLIQYLKTF